VNVILANSNYRLNHATVVKLCHHSIPPQRSSISSANRNFFGASWLFWLLRLLYTRTYLLTYLLMSFKSFLFINVYDSSINSTCKGIQYCNDTQMKAYTTLKNKPVKWKVATVQCTHCYSRCTRLCCTCVVFMQPGWKWMVHISVMYCCSNSCSQTSVKVLATFVLQRATRRQARALSWCDARLLTSHQTRPQFCRLQIVDSHSGMRLSETARDAKHRRWTVVINRCTYYISQGRAETLIRRSGQLCCSFAANLL